MITDTPEDPPTPKEEHRCGPWYLCEGRTGKDEHFACVHCGKIRIGLTSEADLEDYEEGMPKPWTPNPPKKSEDKEEEGE